MGSIAVCWGGGGFKDHLLEEFCPKCLDLRYLTCFLGGPELVGKRCCATSQCTRRNSNPDQISQETS